MQLGNGVDHSPDGRHTDSDGPRITYPGPHENDARPPTSRDTTAALGAVGFDEADMGISPHSTPKIEFIYNW